MAKKAKSAKIEKNQTSSKKNTSSKSDSSSKKKKTSSGGNKVAKFFKDLKSEFNKVVWPSKKQVFNNTLVVLATMVILGIFVGGLDTLMFKALQWVVSKA